MTVRGWGSSCQTLQEGRELDRRGLADGAPEQRALGHRIEATPAVHDVRDHLPCPRTRESFLRRLGVEGMQQLGAHRHEEKDLRSDSIRRTPGAPVRRIDPDLQMDEARGERCGHAVDDAAVALAVAAGDQRGALGEFVLAAFAVEHELIERGLHHRQGRGQFLQVDQPASVRVRGRQESRRRPAGAVGAVAPRDAAQIDRVQQQGADIDILAAGLRRDLLGDLTLGAPWSTPDHHRLAGFDQQRQGAGEFARAQRVIGGDGVGLGHGMLQAGTWGE